MEWRESDGVRWLRGRPGRRRGPPSRPGSAASARRPSTASTSASSPTTTTTAVVENRRRLAAALGLDPARIPIGLQVHGAELAVHAGPQEPSPFAEPGSRDRPRSTATSSPRPGLAPLVFTADCLPVALAGPGGRGDAALRLARARGRDRRRRRRGGRRHRRRDRPRDRPLLLRGRRRGARRLRRTLGDGRSPTGPACSTCPRWRGGCWPRPGSSGSSRPGSAPAARPELFFSHRRDAGRTGRQGGLAWIEPGRPEVAELIHGIDPAKVARQPRAGARARPARASRSSSPAKYVPLEEMGALAEAGRDAWSARTASRTSPPSTSAGATPSTWDFIGNLQSRKVKQMLPLCRLIHSVATDSVLRAARQPRHAGDRGPDRGQRRRRGGQGRRRARRARRPSSSAARSGSAA